MERKLYIKKINNGWLVEREMESENNNNYTGYSIDTFVFTNVTNLEEFLSEELASMDE